MYNTMYTLFIWYIFNNDLFVCVGVCVAEATQHQCDGQLPTRH